MAAYLPNLSLTVVCRDEKISGARRPKGTMKIADAYTRSRRFPQIGETGKP